MSTERIAIYDYVMERLTIAIDTGKYTYEEISEGSGVPKRSLEKIKRKEFKNPGVSHIESLANFFRERESEAA